MKANKEKCCHFAKYLSFLLYIRLKLLPLRLKNRKQPKMSQLIKPKEYKRLLDMKQTEQGIKLIKEFFQQNLSTELRLHRVTAPLFVLKGLGINDDLNGVERAVTFPIKDLGDARAEVVHSLAKWKRLTLAEYDVEPGYGIYTDMNAIRADEELDNQIGRASCRERE